MARPPRPDILDGVHHVMNRGIDHADVFFCDNDRIEFGERLAEVHARFGVVTLAYCLMDNHYHLVLRCPEGGLSNAMQSIGAVFTRHVNDRAVRDGALFRGRFHSLLITDDAYLQSAVRYIHRNALDLPGVTGPADYRWSSHRSYLGLRRTPPWLDVDTVLGAWNGDRAAFDRFVGDDVAMQATAPNAADLRAMVGLCELLVAELHTGEQRRAGSLARTLAIAWAADRGVDVDVLMDGFNVATVNAMRVAISRARNRVAASGALRELCRRASERFDAIAGLQLSSDPGCHQRAARAAS